jgi:hypothetical protein
LLTVVCGACLVCAIFNSVLSMGLHILEATPDYLVKSVDRPRSNKIAILEEFMTAGSLNDPLVEIMVSFWPQSSGNMSYYGN